MFSLIKIIIAMSVIVFYFYFVSISISTISKNGFNINENINAVTKTRSDVEMKTINHEIPTANKISVIEQQTIKNVNVYDFKNTETIIYPILTLLVLFFVLKKFNIVTIKISSFINTIKTKKILKKINAIKAEQIFDITNLSELQIIKNNHLLNLNKDAVELSTYNDLLVSKHNSIIEKIPN